MMIDTEMKEREQKFCLWLVEVALFLTPHRIKGLHTTNSVQIIFWLLTNVCADDGAQERPWVLLKSEWEAWISLLLLQIIFVIIEILRLLSKEKQQQNVLSLT